MQAKKSRIGLISLSSAVVGGLIVAISIYFLNPFMQNGQTRNVETQGIVNTQSPYGQYASFSNAGEPIDFSVAAEHTVATVVHVKVSYTAKNVGGFPGGQGGSGNELYDFFFGNPNSRQRPDMAPAQSSGSGVFVSADGYILTNAHVIDKAENIKVTLNDKTTLQAKLVGSDPNTDIALLKVERIEGNDFPFVTFADSDNLRLGQWVLAVGNPLNLTSTVTAGIVSAKARELNLSNNSFRIESFIQTDAAVNSGNSGGALVNLRGELVGINTAIASRSGGFEGYSFAVPSNIAQKVMKDLMEFGVVQRAILGVRYFDLGNDQVEAFAKQEGIKNIDELKKLKGVYISEVIENSAASDAGIKTGDVLTHINNRVMLSTSHVSEEIGKLRPGDKVSLTVVREGKVKQLSAILRNKAGNTEVVKEADDVLAKFGAEFKPVSPQTARQLGISGGLQVVKLNSGKLKSQGVREGYIITHVNQKAVLSEDDLKKIVQQQSSGGIFLSGIYPNGQEGYYAFAME